MLRFSMWLFAAIVAIGLAGSIASACAKSEPGVTRDNITWATAEEWDSVRAWAEAHPDTDRVDLPWAKW